MSCREGVVFCLLAAVVYTAAVSLNCEDGYERQGLLCYAECKDGYTGVGPMCWEICPPGYTNLKVTCSRGGIYGRDVSDCPWYDKCGLCDGPWYNICGKRRDCGKPCKEGYHNDGCTCRSGVTFKKKDSYFRGVGKPVDMD